MGVLIKFLGHGFSRERESKWIILIKPQHPLDDAVSHYISSNQKLALLD